MNKQILFSSALVLSLVACHSPYEGMEDHAYVCTATVEPTAHVKASDFQAVLDLASTKGVPGAVAYLQTADGETWLGASGYASLEHQAPMEPCHRMLVASVSKMFTATAVFQLVERGLVDLEAPLGEYVQGEYMDRIENAKVVTIRQMLNHTSGLYDYLWPISFELWSIQEPNNAASLEEKLQLAYGRKPTHAPGETYSYSNTNYVLLGVLIEQVSGLALEDYLEQEVFGPLGLSSAYMGTDEAPIPAGVPEGYLSLQGSERLQPSAFYYSNDLATGDGGIAIRMDELGRFLEALTVGEVLRPETCALMQADFVLPEDWQGGYHTRNAQGFEIYETPFGTAYGHTGAIVGFLTTAWYFPDQEVTLVVSINGVSPRIEDLRTEMVDGLLAALFGE